VIELGNYYIGGVWQRLGKTVPENNNAKSCLTELLSLIHHIKEKNYSGAKRLEEHHKTT